MSDASFREVSAERLVLREPGGGRVRAVLETAPGHDADGEPSYPAVRLVLLTAPGDEALVAEVGGDGRARVTVRYGARSVVVAADGVAVWADGNEVAAVDSRDGGRLVLCDRAGRVVVEVPSWRISGS